MSFWFPNRRWEPIARLYGFAVSRRNLAYDSGKKTPFRAKFPVISVGNIHAGGVGKTPVAEYLMRELLSQGKRVAYLSRGYGRTSRGYCEVPSTDDSDYRRFGDEAVQVARKFPQARVAVCESRAEGLGLLEAYQPDIAVLDDAFQHRAVARNLDLVVLDATRPLWEERLLPAGYLREPVAALHRADYLLVNKLRNMDDWEVWKAYLQPFGKPVGAISPAWSALRQLGTGVQFPLSFLQGKAVIALSGIGNPAFFHQQIKAAGARLVHTVSFPDHHAFQDKDLKKLIHLVAKIQRMHAEVQVFTTEKDAMRLRGAQLNVLLPTVPVFYPLIELVWLQGEHELRRAMANVTRD